MNTLDKNNKRFFIHTLGCKVNQYESQAMREILTRSGFAESASRDMADVYILNTCTVTHEADRDSRHWIGLFHRANPNARIVVTGCYVEKNADDISFLPGVFHILKNEDKSRIADILDPGTQGPNNQSRNLYITDFKDHVKAFVKIQDGCGNMCSYCKVPLVRGRLKSRTLSEITEEVRVLSEKGFKEIVLTGICLGAWGEDLFPKEVLNIVGVDGTNIVDVLESIIRLPGNFRIRLSSIEPKYVTGGLIKYIADNARICRHLHIPLQSGDDDILKKMNRSYTASEYKELIGRVRRGIKGVAITTDVLIGFPGESDDNFNNTVNFIKEVLPMRTHIFTFSRRSGTAASAMGPQAAGDVLKKRYHELNVAALGASYIYRQGFLDKSLDILVEAKRDKQSGLLTGYSGNYIKVLFNGPDDIMGSIAPVKIKELNLMHTLGEYGDA